MVSAAIHSSPLYDPFSLGSRLADGVKPQPKWPHLPFLVRLGAVSRFEEEMRPVKLTTKVLGYAPAKNDFLFKRVHTIPVL
ncbi:putative ATP-dependent DNA helicase HFM1 [Hordeum vulgare]|nr:putative ATP-dependent DNA helicase HFM1 [Hordeum vulgare]